MSGRFFRRINANDIGSFSGLRRQFKRAWMILPHGTTPVSAQSVVEMEFVAECEKVHSFGQERMVVVQRQMLHNVVPFHCECKSPPARIHNGIVPE
mmetsp:Transcript_12747/g.29648  ORF Transcript_12747/g.29648 Transcript_12747/m.29648 type:complete len:96 (-) Transcript_12747:509-796(-)